MHILKYTPEYTHLVKDFECGNIVIDNFIRNVNPLDENQGVTYLLLSDKKDFVIGYYTIEVSRVDQVETIGSDIYYKPMGGSVNINYLAIHTNYQGTKIIEIDGKNVYFGDYILRDCEKRILKLRNEVGITFITLYSTEKGYHLYHVRNEYEIFEEDMSTFVQESDVNCYKLYKWIDDIAQ